jgi:hypothetical protein
MGCDLSDCIAVTFIRIPYCELNAKTAIYALKAILSVGNEGFGGRLS